MLLMCTSRYVTGVLSKQLSKRCCSEISTFLTGTKCKGEKWMNLQSGRHIGRGLLELSSLGSWQTTNRVYEEKQLSIVGKPLYLVAIIRNKKLSITRFHIVIHTWEAKNYHFARIRQKCYHMGFQWITKQQKLIVNFLHNSHRWESTSFTNITLISG